MQAVIVPGCCSHMQQGARLPRIQSGQEGRPAAPGGAWNDGPRCWADWARWLLQHCCCREGLLGFLMSGRG